MWKKWENDAQNKNWTNYTLFKFLFFYSIYDETFMYPTSFIYTLGDLHFLYFLTFFFAILASIYTSTQYNNTTLTFAAVAWVYFFLLFRKCFVTFFFLVFKVFRFLLSIFFKKISYFFRKIRKLFIFWRPIFKKFGYLLNFFKFRK